MGKIDEQILEFIKYLHNVKKASENTQLSYKRDLRKMSDYLQAHGVTDGSEVTEITLSSYILDLENKNFTAATVSRSIASMKAFFHYFVKEGQFTQNPAENLKAPKIEKKLPSILSPAEVIRLLERLAGS